VELFRAWIAQLPPDRPIVKHWTMEDFAAGWEQEISGRVATEGERHFRTTGCIQCHRIGDEGGVVGPSLQAIGSRLKPQELLESVLLPSKLIAEGYAGVTIETADGRLLTGRIEHEDGERIILRPASASEPSVVLAPEDVIARERLTTSNMPTGTVNVLARDEILDLIAYLAAQRDTVQEPGQAASGR
jgi:putative heme-binding domain-containing protein